MVAASTVVALVIVVLSGLLVPWINRGWLNAIVPMILYNVKMSRVEIIMLGILSHLISTVPILLRDTSYLQRYGKNSPFLDEQLSIAICCRKAVGLTNYTVRLSEFIGVLPLNCCRIEEDS